MSKISRSPQRNTFQKENYIKRATESGKNLNDEDVSDMLDYYSSWDLVQAEREASEEWRENNMEYDLRTTDWILEKVRASDIYAQNLYAAMCNNDFQKNEFMPRLAGKTWSCSWRSAGGVVANMREQGDYIDWYCSGIRNGSLTDSEFDALTEEQKTRYKETQAYVSESVVTDEIRSDLKKLGWDVIPYNDEQIG
jgi:hypothetical protein